MDRLHNWLTRPEVHHNVYKEDSVGETVEGNPACAEVIVEERNGDWKDDEVSNKQQ